MPKRIQGQEGDGLRVMSREQTEDTCQHTPHKANVQGHETITDAKQESGNKAGAERGKPGVSLGVRVVAAVHVQRPEHWQRERETKRGREREGNNRSNPASSESGRKSAENAVTSGWGMELDGCRAGAVSNL